MTASLQGGELRDRPTGFLSALLSHPGGSATRRLVLAQSAGPARALPLEVLFAVQGKERHAVMRAAAAITLIVLALTVAGCGGGAAKRYEASEVRGCLVDRNLSLKPADLPGDVAPDGSEGDLAVHVGDNEVDLAFGKDSSEAKSNAQEEKAAASVALGANADAYVRTKGNVAYWVTGTDTSAFDSVEACLK